MASCSSRNHSSNKDAPQEEFELKLDCGGNYHMIKDLYRLLNVVKLSSPKRIVTDGTTYAPEATFQGDLKVEISNRLNKWTKITLKDVFYVANLNQDLLSAKRIVSSGTYEIQSFEDFTDIVVAGTGEILCTATPNKSAKYFSVRQKFDEEDETVRKEIVTLWHRRLAHTSAEIMKHLPNSVTGLPPNFRVKDDDFDDCEVCLKVKSSSNYPWDFSY